MLSDSKLLDYCYEVIDERLKSKGYSPIKTLSVNFDDDRGGVYVKCRASGKRIRFYNYPSAAMVNSRLIPFIDKCAEEAWQYEKENKKEEQPKRKSFWSWLFG